MLQSGRGRRKDLLTGRANLHGVIPVMLTPFAEDGNVDFDGLDRLTDWYLENGVAGLFAVCQSSEMEFLTLAEKVAIAERVLRRVDGKLPVIASGHTSADALEQQEELSALAATGVDAIVLVTNRLDPQGEGEATFRSRLDKLLDRLPSDTPLGLYECPSPYRRLLSDGEVEASARSTRFVVLKDVSCDSATIARRAALVAGTRLAIVNANAAIALTAMKVGSRGFCGVLTNFHPDLYVWLCAHAEEDSALQRDLASFLALSAMVEGMGYPAVAKLFHQRLGTFKSARCRSIDYDVRERFWGLAPTLDIIEETGARFRMRIAEAERNGVIA